MEINFNEPFEFKGWFNLPNSERQVVGILKYDTTSILHLELIGSLHNDFWEGFKTSGLDCLFGIIENGQPITLFRCYREKSYTKVFSNPDYMMATYKCYYMIVGIHLDSITSNIFTSVSVGYEILPYWMQYSAFDVEHRGDGDNRIYTTSLSPKNSKIIDCNINSHIDLSLQIYGGYSLERYTTTYYNNGLLKLNYKSSNSICNILNDIEKFSDFLTLATLNKQYCYTAKLSDGENYYPIYITQFNYEELNSSNRKLKQDFLFTYNSIENIFPKLISNWYNCDEIKKLLISHLIDSITFKKIFSVNDFLVVIQALDGFCYDETRNRQLPLEQRLKLMFEKYKHLFIFKDSNFDFAKIASTRNFYSHLGKKGDRVIESMRELLITKDELRKILICCVMEFVGFSIDEIETITKSNSTALSFKRKK